MGRQVQRLSDANTGGGTITTPLQSTVFANGLPVAVIGSSGSSHINCGSPGGDQHCAGNWVTSAGAATVFVNGLPVNLTGDPDTCGHSRAGGSPDVFAE